MGMTRNVFCHWRAYFDHGKPCCLARRKTRAGRGQTVQFRSQATPTRHKNKPHLAI